MDKPILFYEVRVHQNRITGGPVYVPAIVEREEAVPLETVIERAIDRGLIAGIKPSAAKQIADAIAQQMYEEFRAGRGVKFGNYFYARLYLDGTSDSDGKLTSANSINVRFVNGTGFKLTMDMFSFSNVNGGDIPGTDFLISEADGAERGVLIPNENVILNGVNLWRDGDAGTKVGFYGIDPAGKRAAVVGRSLVIGRPVGQLLLHADATVTLCHSRTPELPAVCREADILIVAVGRAGMIGAEHTRPGQVILDVGVNSVEGKLCGDVRTEEAEETAAAVSPVPGGIGAVTPSVLMAHLVEAAERAAR